MIPLLVPKTTEEIVEQAVEDARNTAYFDMGQNIQSAFQQQHDDLLWSSVMAGGLLGSGLGGAVASNGPAVNPGVITLESLHGGGLCLGMQVIADPAVPPNEIRYVFPRQTERYDIFEPDARLGVPAGTYRYGLREDGNYGFSPIEQIAPELFQFQRYLNDMQSAMLCILGMPSAETQEQRAVRETKRKAAESRAEQLMFTILRPEQVKQYSEHGYFECECDDRLYRIHNRSHSANVELIVNGKAVFSYCAHPQNCYETPVVDTMLSQLLMLKADERKFLATANKTRLM